ncbi:MAG: helix-turn-helix domain-containing protein [Rhodococcus sp. (in: high G+C Gram-positive bacteria)]
MVTVEVDPACVESRLLSGEISCPSCVSGVLGGWGHARRRAIVGSVVAVRPRRSRCRGCRATHVLLPVALLLRRAYLAELILSALEANACGLGYSRIAARLDIPAATVRGWIRAVTAGVEVLRNWFLAVAVTAGVDVSVSKATGTRCGDVLAAVDVARCAVVDRFGADSLGVVTAAVAAVAMSGGRLLSPGWPTGAGVAGAPPVASAISGGDDRSSDTTV